MPQLGSSRALMCSYLHEVFQRDARVAASYHDMQLELYADHNPQQLLPFMRKSSEYSPDVAFKLCKAREFVPEQVFLLARLGNVSEALLLLLRRMRDVKAAVDFCLEHQDGQLWDTLINSCFDDALLIPPLLDCIGVHPQPLRVVSRIPLGVEIAGLKEKVVMPRRLPPSFRRFYLPVLVSGCEHRARPPSPVRCGCQLHSHHQRGCGQGSAAAVPASQEGSQDIHESFVRNLRAATFGACCSGSPRRCRCSSCRPLACRRAHVWLRPYFPRSVSPPLALQPALQNGTMFLVCFKGTSPYLTPPADSCLFAAMAELPDAAVGRSLWCVVCRHKAKEAAGKKT